MSNRHQNNKSVIERIHRWLVSPDGFAAVAAGSGEPAPLLALEGYRRRAQPPTRQRARRPDAWTQRTSWVKSVAAPIRGLPDRDHIRGRSHAPVTLLAYGSFGCRYSSAAASVIPDLLDSFAGQVRYVYRHLPLTDIEPNPQLAAEAVEAAGEQGEFWAMHDRLSSQPEQITLDAIYRAALAIGLNLDRFSTDLGRHAHAEQIARDVRSADASNVSGTPAFFIDGRRYSGAFDLDSLTAELAAAVPARIGEPVAIAA